MSDLLTEALTYPGLGWIALGALIAGAVRGFSGFGTALVFLPVAGQFLSPIWALTVLTVMDAF
ncbi:MAG TPA: sulfite exporter TauE/SafE family protein, partial [Rhodobacteraceae bacterium]|nr:sulfite exporter TauE/SafE family protein [Paracoccaceae bacterium]